MPVQAKRSADFIDSIGINVHVTQGGQYANTSKLTTDLSYLGVNLVRDHLTANSGQVDQMSTLSRAGIKWDFFGDGTPSSDMSAAKAFLARNPGGIASLEGPNETNNFSFSYAGKTGDAAGQQYTNDMM